MPQLFLSHSKLEMLSRCGHQYYLRYIEGKRRPPLLSALRGLAVNAGVDADMIEKMNTGELLPEQAVLDTARDALAAEWEKAGGEVEMNAADQELGADVARGRSTDTVISLARLHHRVIAPAVAPVAVQRRFSFDIRGTGVTLVGVTDVEEMAALWDTKTSARKLPEDSANKSNQLTIYAMGRRAETGEFPERVGLHGLISGKVPQVQVQESRRTREDFGVFLNRVEAAVVAIERGVFVPADPNAIASPCSWCGYRSSCKYIRQPVTVAT